MANESSHTASSPAATGMDRHIDRPRGAKRIRLVVALIAALALAFAVWWAVPTTGSIDVDSASIETGVTRRAAFADYLPLRATVAPAVTTYVGAVTGGQVEAPLVQDGARVAAGQPLATLANPTLKLEVLTREAEIASQLGALSGDELALERGKLDRRSQTSAASYDLLKAQRDLSVRQQLHTQGFVSDAGVRSYQEEADYQQRRLTQLHSGEARERQTATLQSSRLADTRRRLSTALSAVEAQLGALTLRAPATGRLTGFAIKPGQTLKAGDQAGQIDSEGNWKLVAEVDEYYLGRVHESQAATANGGLQLTVSKVLPAVTDGHFRVEFTFRGAMPGDLNRGQAIDVRLTLGATQTVLVVPAGGWLDSGSGSSAFVLDSSGRRAHRRNVTTGRRNPEQVEILSGLAPGERIVISNTAAIKGDEINIH